MSRAILFRGKGRGLTLIETVIAIFMLTSGILVLFRLFHVALQYSTRAEHQAVAALVGERKLAALRAWARTLGGGPGLYNFDGNWAGIDSGPAPDEYEPDYQVTVRQQSQNVDSPCSELEKVWPATARRTMSQSYRKIQITVTWGDISGQNLVLVSLIGAPAHVTTPCTITMSAVGTIPNPVPANATVEFSAVVKDPDGNIIPDVMCSQVIRPEVNAGATIVGGNAILDDSDANNRRDGATAVLKNCYPGFGRNWTQAPGRLIMEGICRYHGIQLADDGQRLRMSP